MSVSTICIDPRESGKPDHCGKPSVFGYRYCQPCLEYYEERFPQGWKYYAGDVCMHGQYTGGCGADLMCGGCEDGYTTRVDCSVDGCDQFEFTRHDEPIVVFHAPNPVRSSIAQQIKEERHWWLKIKADFRAQGAQTIDNSIFRNQMRKRIDGSSAHKRWVHDRKPLAS